MIKTILKKEKNRYSYESALQKLYSYVRIMCLSLFNAEAVIKWLL